ncbi:MAG: type II CAAX endopeptidase family protein [Thermodesulfobacteriota bacterium]|nr:type II CAAX endopeptidase family protein [Thermodesulfobacteriota bacterium]
METKSIKLKTVIISSASVIILDVMVSALFPKGIFPAIVLLGIIRMIEISLLILIVLKIEKGLSPIGLTLKAVIPGIKKGILWSVGFGLITAIAFSIMYLANIDAFKLIGSRLPKDQNDLIFYFVVGGIIGPVAEEIFFRGILYGFLRRFGAVVAILLSTAAFAVFHPVGSGIPITQIIGGILFAVSYEFEKNLFVPIVIHTSGNLSIFLLS